MKQGTKVPGDVPVWPCYQGRCACHPEITTGGGRRPAVVGATGWEVAMSQEQKAQALAQAAGLLGRDDDAGIQVLSQLWDAAFEGGRLDALDELQDRFCVCMK